MIALIFLLLGAELPKGKTYEYVNPCEQSVEHLSPQKQIDMSIGCSYVNGMRVSRDPELWSILNEKE